MKKRIISLALAVMMVVCLLPMTALATLVAVNGKTKVDSMTYNGVTVDSYYTNWFDGYDSDSYYCCAALVSRFYRDTMGLTVNNLYPGYHHQPNVNTGSFQLTNTPQVGDIAASRNHWAIIKEAGSGYAVLFEQNCWNTSNNSQKTSAVVGRHIYPVLYIQK